MLHRTIRVTASAMLAALAVAGCKDTDGVTDTFTASGPGETDMLWILDNSASMDDAQGQLLDNFSAFVDGLPDGSRTQLGITTTQAWPCTQDISSAACDDRFGTTGRVARDGNAPALLDPMDADDELLFLELADVGVYGAGDERVLQVALMALCEALELPDTSDFVDGVDDLEWDFPWGCSGSEWDPDHALYDACHCLPASVEMKFDDTVETAGLRAANTGLLRGNPLHIVIVTDEGDDTSVMMDVSSGQCDDAAPGDQCTCRHQAVLALIEPLVPDLAITVIGPGQGGDGADRYTCNPQAASECAIDWHLWSAEVTGGRHYPIQVPDEEDAGDCDKADFAAILADVVLETPTTEWFSLTQAPQRETFEVRVAGQPAPQLAAGSACSDAAFGGGGWTYDEARNAVALSGDCAADPGETVEIGYMPAEVSMED